MTALIYCPFPDEASARRVGSALLDEGLIGCINIGGGVTSLFAWQGERGESAEVAALCKTDAGLLEQAIARLEALHPYETPAVLGWPCAAGEAAREWLGALS